MDYLYFSHEWVANTADFGYLFKEMFANPLGLEYELIFTGSERGVSDEGYALITLVVRVSSKSGLDEFVSKVSGKIGIREWQPASEDDFREGVNPTKVPPLFHGKYLESIWERAWCNQTEK